MQKLFEECDFEYLVDEMTRYIHIQLLAGNLRMSVHHALSTAIRWEKVQTIEDKKRKVRHDRKKKA